MENTGKDKKLSLNIVPVQKEHRGFGAGSIDLSQVSSIIIDGNEAYLDMGALHAKSKVEKGIKFSTDPESVPNGRKCWIIWVATDRSEQGPYYAGVTACEMRIDSESRKGYKILAEHVNNMDRAMKRKIMLAGLNADEKKALRQALESHNTEWWNNSGEELKSALS